MNYRRADVIYNKCDDKPTLVSAVQFHGINRTKYDALVKEIAPIYDCKTLDELIHKSHMAAIHMQVIF